MNRPPRRFTKGNSHRFCCIAATSRFFTGELFSPMAQDSPNHSPCARFAVAPALTFPALVALLLAAWSTSRYGDGVSPDSAHYIGAARSLAAGQGLRFNGEPFSHWPPLYTLILAGPSL